MPVLAGISLYFVPVPPVKETSPKCAEIGQDKNLRRLHSPTPTPPRIFIPITIKYQKSPLHASAN